MKTVLWLWHFRVGVLWKNRREMEIHGCVREGCQKSDNNHATQSVQQLTCFNWKRGLTNDWTETTFSLGMLKNWFSNFLFTSVQWRLPTTVDSWQIHSYRFIQKENWNQWTIWLNQMLKVCKSDNVTHVKVNKVHCWPPRTSQHTHTHTHPHLLGFKTWLTLAGDTLMKDGLENCINKTKLWFVFFKQATSCKITS